MQTWKKKLLKQQNITYSRREDYSTLKFEENTGHSAQKQLI